jgi:hypothetical protein
MWGRCSRVVESTYWGRWIGSRGPSAWPPRSPALTLVYVFFLWGYSRGHDYAFSPWNIKDLMARLKADNSWSQRTQKNTVSVEMEGGLFSIEPPMVWMFDSLRAICQWGLLKAKLHSTNGLQYLPASFKQNITLCRAYYVCPVFAAILHM